MPFSLPSRTILGHEEIDARQYAAVYGWLLPRRGDLYRDARHHGTITLAAKRTRDSPRGSALESSGYPSNQVHADPRERRRQLTCSSKHRLRGEVLPTPGSRIQ